MSLGPGLRVSGSSVPLPSNIGFYLPLSLYLPTLCLSLSTKGDWLSSVQSAKREKTEHFSKGEGGSDDSDWLIWVTCSGAGYSDGRSHLEYLHGGWGNTSPEGGDSVFRRSSQAWGPSVGVCDCGPQPIFKARAPFEHVSPESGRPGPLLCSIPHPLIAAIFTPFEGSHHWREHVSHDDAQSLGFWVHFLLSLVLFFAAITEFRYGNHFRQD